MKLKVFLSLIAVLFFVGCPDTDCQCPLPGGVCAIRRSGEPCPPGEPPRCPAKVCVGDPLHAPVCLDRSSEGCADEADCDSDEDCEWAVAAIASNSRFA